jgi:sortase A
MELAPTSARQPTPPSGHRPRRSMGPLRRGVREVGLALITAGVMVLLFVVYQLWGTNFAEASSQHKLARSFHQQVAEHPPSASTADSPTLGAQAPAAPVTGAIDHLVIPKIGVSKYVVEGIGENDLEQGPGHYPQTVLPGQLGNSAIAGHRTTYGAPFFSLNDLTAGDIIQLTDTADRLFTYRVTTNEVVSPSDVSVLNNTPGVATLTLTTCNPRYYATSRLIVVARLTGNPLPAPPPAAHPPPAALASEGNLGSGDSGAWPAVALFGAIVLVGWVLVRLAINRTRRWARLGAYVVGIGVLLVPFWFLCENTARLLPQSI